MKRRIKFGRWIIVDDCERFIAKCSVCNCLQDSRLIDEIRTCPKCEARMSGINRRFSRNVKSVATPAKKTAAFSPQKASR